MKMSSVIQPQSSSVGVGQHSYDEMRYGLSWLSASEGDILGGLNGVGAMVYSVGGRQNMSVMDAIIRNAREMNIKTTILNDARAKAAKENPQFALKLNAAKNKTAAPGTNVAAAVKNTSMKAAGKAMEAKVLEDKARKLLKAGDKRAAAAQSVNALTAAREAIILSTRAEQARLTSSLDQTAYTLEEQARYVEGVMQNEIARSGPTSKTDAMRARALNLKSEAAKLRKISAVVAISATIPPSAPTQQRIAEVANKFNIRSVGRGTQEGAMSVLSDLSDSALAQVRDYDGAMKFYGGDAVGRLMCDMEFDNRDGAVKGLAGAIHGMGYVDTLPVFAMADNALAQGVQAAKRGFVEAVMPAYVGQRQGLQQHDAASGLGGLGALGGAFEDWCDSKVPSGATPSAKKYNGDVSKCKNPKGNPPSFFNFFVFAPWDQLGLLERGVQDWGQTAAEVGKGIMSGDIKVNLPAIPGAVTPPATTRPPPTFPQVSGGGGDGGGYGGGGGGGGSNYGSNYKAPSNTMLYVGIGAGVLVLGAGVYMTMFSPRA